MEIPLENVMLHPREIRRCYTDITTVMLGYSEGKVSPFLESVGLMSKVPYELITFENTISINTFPIISKLSAKSSCWFAQDSRLEDWESRHWNIPQVYV
jgi:hypothetical protein